LPRPTDARGFTLIEVLAAVLIVSLVFGLLLESVTRNLHDLSRARNEARAAQLAEDRLRDLKAELAAGTPIQDGITDGLFDAPDQDMHWQISVTPQTLALPPDYRGDVPPSPLFYAANGPPRPPVQPPPPTAEGGANVNTGPQEPLRLVEVRVFPDGSDPQTVEPFVLLVTAPPDASHLQQQGGNPQNGIQGDPNALGGQRAPAGASGRMGSGMGMGTSP
jgi:prepilin-type N-terminal cleavage/methylation domain-containing protein